ncbi:hypothetical protein ASD89_10035 [Caulobacter sp. Root656]|nr:hypothetical protein ASD89_10035 [Caulobacter sp. Root656]
MRITLPLVALALSLLVVASAPAQPPPPILSPPELDKPYDGYDLRTPYQLWRYWVENQKGPVTEALMAQPDSLPDEGAFGSPLITFKAFGDMGHFLTGDLRAYCRRKPPYDFDRDNCHYVLRRATVPVAAASYGTENGLSTWTRQNFGPEKLARHLKAAGFAPDIDWWIAADRQTMFAEQPSPAALLKSQARVVRVDSRDCPALAKAIGAMETRRLGLPVDFWAVGPKGVLDPPPPHATQWLYVLNLIVAGHAVTVEGDHALMSDIVDPVFKAAQACEQAGKPQQ